MARSATVAILFVDMTGSTELASSRPATEVVELLNEFFGVVVETVDEHGGWVNKFEGDAALAVFGAPQEIDDPAGRALRGGARDERAARVARSRRSRPGSGSPSARSSPATSAAPSASSTR